MNMKKAVLATAFITMASTVQAAGDVESKPVPPTVDCAVEHPKSLEDAIGRSGMRSNSAHAKRLDEMLSYGARKLTAIKDAEARKVFDRLALLIDNGNMVSAEIANSQAVGSVPAWKTNPRSELVTEMLQSIYEPFSPGLDGTEEDMAFVRDLMKFKDQIESASRAIPGYERDPVRWFVQAVVYRDPVAASYASGQLCSQETLRDAVASINRELPKIME